MNLRLVDGDLLDQEVEVIINAWNGISFLGGFCCPKASREPSSAAQVSHHFES